MVMHQQAGLLDTVTTLQPDLSTLRWYQAVDGFMPLRILDHHTNKPVNFLPASFKAQIKGGTLDFQPSWPDWSFLYSKDS